MIIIKIVIQCLTEEVLQRTAYRMSTADEQIDGGKNSPSSEDDATLRHSRDIHLHIDPITAPDPVRFQIEQLYRERQ